MLEGEPNPDIVNFEAKLLRFVAWRKAQADRIDRLEAQVADLTENCQRRGVRAIGGLDLSDAAFVPFKDENGLGVRLSTGKVVYLAGNPEDCLSVDGEKLEDEVQPVLSIRASLSHRLLPKLNLLYLGLHDRVDLAHQVTRHFVRLLRRGGRA